MIYPILGVLLGLVLGHFLPVVPQDYMKLLSVALMASLGCCLWWPEELPKKEVMIQRFSFQVSS